MEFFQQLGILLKNISWGWQAQENTAITILASMSAHPTNTIIQEILRAT
jgi:hypothetical protein